MRYDILGKSVFIDGPTGSLGRSEAELGVAISSSPDFDGFCASFSGYQTASVTFCLNLSDACNLACDYCFNGEKTGVSISVADCITFLDGCFSRFPNKEKYFVDLSGKGEPLFFLAQDSAILTV